MTVIKQDDLIQSIADALQFISYYHPTDFIRAMRGAWEREESPAAKAALTQVLVNSRMCAIGKRPICQDTGIVNVLISVGMDVQWDADMAFEDMINEGVRRVIPTPITFCAVRCCPTPTVLGRIPRTIPPPWCTPRLSLVTK